MKIDILFFLVLVCMIGGILGLWITLLLGKIKTKTVKNFTLITFIVNSIFLIISGSIIIFYDLAYIRKISFISNLKENLFFSVIAFVTNLISIKGLPKTKEDN